MSHLSSGGDSIRDVPPGNIRFKGGPMSVQGLRDLARENGLDLGSKREDDEDLDHTARHEAGHAVVAWALGWEVLSLDAGAGQTRFKFRPDQLIADRDREYATIAAAGCEATGSWVDSNRDELASDRYDVSSLTGSHTAFDEGRLRARELLADPEVKRFHARVVDALIERKILITADLAELDNE